MVERGGQFSAVSKDYHEWDNVTLTRSFFLSTSTIKKF